MKGRKAERLPDDIRSQFYQMLESKQLTCQEIADQVNDMLLEFDGETDVDSIDDNTVWREAKRMELINEQMRSSQQYAEAMNEKYDLTQLGTTGRLLLTMLSGAAFKTMQHHMGKSEPIDPETLGDLVLSIQRLQRTSNFNAEFEKQIREKAQREVLDAAAHVVDDVAKERNLSPGDIVHIRERLYGIYDTPKALV